MTHPLFFLLNHLWQSTLMAGVAWVACRTMLKTNPPAIRFGVWLAASIKFLIPFALLIDLGHSLAPRPPLSPAQSQRVFDVVRAGGGGLAAAPFRDAHAPQAPVEWQGVFLKGFVILWTAGAIVILIRWIRNWQTILSAARQARPVKIFRGIPVLESRGLREQGIEPGVFGIWRPSILIPDGIEDALSAAQLDALLFHEWNHVRRRDNLTAAFQMLTETLFWFYPVVRWIGRNLIAERELACDQAVLDQAKPEDYAEGILNVCKLYRSSPLACVSGISGADLRKRVELILACRRPCDLGASRRYALAGAMFTAIAGPAFVGFLTGPAASAQQVNSFQGLATSAEKKFEVATVKPSDPDSKSFNRGAPANGAITIINTSLRDITILSFRVTANLLSGGPDWIANTNYDIVGKGPDPKATSPEVWEMMRSLLIERFQLKYHVENREMPVFALSVATRGLKLTLGENGKCAADIKAGKACSDIQPRGASWAIMHNMPIGALIQILGNRAGRPIVDRTGLTGRYDANLSWVPPGQKYEDLDLTNVASELRPQDASIFDALEQQAGLKLTPTRAEVAVVVIDSMSRPDPN
jgi:bla regulator protein blaR1